MNVLKISLDINLLKGKQGGEYNDSLQRRILLAEGVDNLFVIVFSTIKVENPLTPVEKLKIFSTCSLNKITRLLDAVRIGKKLCAANKIDLITTQDPFFTGRTGMRLAGKFGIPLNVQIHSQAIDNSYWLQERPLNRLMNVIGKRVLKKADSVRVVAPSEKEKLIRMGYPADRIWVVAESIDPGKFRNADGSEIRKAYRQRGYGKILFFAGRLYYPKNLSMLLRAFKIVLAEFPEVLLVIAGEGKERPCMEALTKRLKIEGNVEFAGLVSLDDLPDYYDAADLFVLSSNHEGGPRVVKEAAVVGIPIVSTAVGVVDEIVENGVNGFTVETGDVRAFARRVVDVLSDDQIRARCKNMREKMAGKFGRKRHIEGIHKIWWETIRGYAE